MTIRIFVLFLVVAALVSVSIASTCTEQEFAAVKAAIKLEVSRTNDPQRWPARLLRIGFHDCFPGSCDGSIAHELGRNENARIGVTVNLLRRAILNTCCSLADAIKLGVEASMELSGGPPLRCHRGVQTIDAAGPNPGGLMPDRADAWAVQASKYAGRGYSAQDVVASSLGGHSLGRFNRGRQSVPFTPTEDMFNNDFVEFASGAGAGAGNGGRRGGNRRGNGAGNTQGFNALASDLVIAIGSDATTRGHVDRYAADEGALRTDFADFINRLCQM